MQRPLGWGERGTLEKPWEGWCGCGAERAALCSQVGGTGATGVPLPQEGLQMVLKAQAEVPEQGTYGTRALPNLFAPSFQSRRRGSRTPHVPASQTAGILDVYRVVCSRPRQTRFRQQERAGGLLPAPSGCSRMANEAMQVRGCLQPCCKAVLQPPGSEEIIVVATAATVVTSRGTGPLVGQVGLSGGYPWRSA